MVLSIEESIQRLRAEIIAQDWRLSPRRLESIETAFACLKKRFKTRKGMLTILAMADSVVIYIKKQDEAPPETIDFLKESMAHIVNLYEEHDYNPDHEEELFQRLFKRYNTLKQKVQVSQDRSEGNDNAPPPTPVTRETVAAKEQKSETITPQEDRLLARLRLLLSRTDGSTAVLQKFLAAAVVLAEAGEPLTITRFQALLNTLREQSPLLPPPAEKNIANRQHKHQPIACEATPVRRLSIGSTHILVPEELIALSRPLKAAKISSCLRNGRIGLSDFSHFMQGLAAQFSGPLAEMKDRQLKKLALPAMTPRGLNLQEMPDENATEVLVISHDNWHGALFCAEIDKEVSSMIKFCKGNNGDIAGTAWLTEGDPLPLLNVKGLLRREGFLTMVNG